MDQKQQELSEGWQKFSHEDKADLIKTGLLSYGPPPRVKKDVVIVGAGMAGLVAAFELQRTEWFNVTILEARQNVGGRIRTIREPYFSEGLYGEAGAMRIPNSHKLTLEYINRAGTKEDERGAKALHVYSFKNHDENAWCYFNAKQQIRWRAYEEKAKAGTDYFEFGLSEKERDERLTIAQKFQEDIIKPLRRRLDELTKSESDAPRMSREEALRKIIEEDKLREFSTRRYLSQPKFDWSQGAVTAFGLLENQQARLNNGVVALLREYLTDSFTEPGKEEKFLQIYGGMDLLPRSFLPYLEENTNIIFGTRMEGLSKETHPEEKAVVHYKNISGFKAEKEQAGKAIGHFAIITIPFPMLRHMDGLNNWNESKRRAILGLNYSESGKVLFQCNNRFWETEVDAYPITGGRSQTDLGIRTIYYPTTQEKQTKKAILLVSYTWGRDSQRWTHLSHQDRIQYAFKELAEIHPILKKNPDWIEGAYSIMWQNDEFAGGAFALTNPYQEEHDEACWSVDGRFHFAGEHTSLNYHRWIEGAVESGLRAAWEVYMTASKN